MTVTLTLWISRTSTETVAAGMYSVSAFVRWSRNSIGVNPAAWTSFSSGTEIFPSGRTGTVRVISVLFHTATSRTSSGPITYLAGQRSACDGASCAAAGGLASRTVATRATTAGTRREMKSEESRMSVDRVARVARVATSGGQSNH